MNEPRKNISASVRQRLFNLAKARGVDFQRILVLYALERLLYRLSVSSFADRFILKGASLFSIWFEEPHRRTRDLDLLGKDQQDQEGFIILFRDLCDLSVEDDGMRFASETVKTKLIREQNEFGGIRVSLTAFLEHARIPLQVDIGFGDGTVPDPQEIDFPTLLEGFSSPHLLAYQKETVIAEKLHALVILERSNSRMKDFFDLYVLSQEFEFTEAQLRAAVRDVFVRRKTTIPNEIPDGLTQNFARDPAKIVQWKAFLSENVTPPRNALILAEVVAALAKFLLPLLAEADDASADGTKWQQGGPWKR